MKSRSWSVTPNTTTRIVGGLFRSRNYVWDNDSKVAAGFGVTWTQFLILRSLRFASEDFTMSPTELYSATQASSSGVAKMLKGLEEKGLVNRIPHEQDARSRLVCLTSKGADLVEAIIDQLIVTNSEIFEDVLSEEDRERLADILETLSTKLDARFQTG